MGTPAASVRETGDRGPVAVHLADSLGDRFFCCPRTGAVLRYRVCVARVIEAEREYSRRRKRARGSGGDTRRKRGRVPEFASCDGCPLGQALRRMFGDDVARSVRRSGPPPAEPPALVRLGVAALSAEGGA